MGRPTVTCYSQKGKAKETSIVDAFAKGAGGQVVTSGPLRDGPAAFYGFGQHNRAVFDQVRKQGRDWYYIDNGYFSSTFTAKGRLVYYRVTKNRLQHSGLGKYDPQRFAALNETIHPWRQGTHILVCPPREYWSKWTYNMDHESWLSATLTGLKSNTDRPIKIRYKPPNLKKERPSLHEDLKDCHALVTFMSNTAVEALCHGVQVFVGSESCAWSLSSGSLCNVERLSRPDDRPEWASVLAANQWTLDEMASGKCWRDLNV